MVYSGYEGLFVEACVVDRLTPRTPDLDVLGSSLAHCVVFLDKKLCPLGISLPRCVNGYWEHTAGGGDGTLQWPSILSKGE